jgi:hypothetical protein
MAKGSFRAVPSKVRRFVEFVGADLTTDRLGISGGRGSGI